MRKGWMAVAMVLGAVLACGAVQAQSPTQGQTQGQTATVTVYGKVEPSIDVMRAGDKSIVNMSSNSSRIGFKGADDLGGGFKIIFKLENTYDMVNEAGFMGGRDNYLGMAGPFGTILFGRMNSAYKEAGSKYDPFDDTIGDYKTIMGMGYNSAGAIKQGNANQRYRKSAQYESPNLNGWTLTANVALEEAKDEETDKTAWSAALNYNNGQLDVFAALDRQTKNNGDTDDLTSWKAGAAWTFSCGTTLRAIVEKLKKEDATQPLHTRHVFLGAEHRFNAQWMAMANHIRAADDADHAGAKAFNVGGNYAFSKRTSVLAVYAYTKNEANANYKNDADDALYVAKGGTIKGYSLRLQHKF